MIGNMIKICSLDFLNREIFETDVMTADGVVLFPSGEKITPEILLRLYFREIYIEQPLAEKTRVVSMVSAAVLADATSESSIAKTAVAKNEHVVDNKNIIFEDNETKEKAKKGPRAALDMEEDDEAVKGPRLGDAGDDSEEKEGKGPKYAGINLDEEELEGKGLRSASGDSVVDDDKGPKFAGINLDAEEETEEGPGKGPRSAGLSKFEDDETAENKQSGQAGFVEQEEEVVQINPEELPLVFDEEQAKRIVQYSLKLGKTVGYSKEELKELEIVAYNYNIGITNFKRADVSKKGFRKMKAIAGYEILKEDDTLPYHLAEMVKSCINAYENESFTLEAKIPYYHVVSITGFYEDLLSQNQSKSEILLKMLQLGGHQFNIFILHKFIKMMRDAND
jgi:hypothetical protein